MNTRVAVVLVVAAVAGCSSFGPAGQTPTVTPAPVPESTATPKENTLPPGVTGGGDVAAGRLAQAHRDAVDGLSYDWRTNRTTIGPRGTKRDDIRKHARVENQSTYLYWTNRREAPPEDPFSYLGNYTGYAEPGARFVRYADGADLVYGREDHRTVSDRIEPMATEAIRRYLGVANATVAVTRVDGQRYYRITATEYALPTTWAISDYSVTAVVSPTGFVRSIDASYTRSLGTESERIRYRFRYTEVGTATVDRPAWVQKRWFENGSEAS